MTGIVLHRSIADSFEIIEPYDDLLNDISKDYHLPIGFVELPTFFQAQLLLFFGGFENGGEYVVFGALLEVEAGFEVVIQGL